MTAREAGVVVLALVIGLAAAVAAGLSAPPFGAATFGGDAAAAAAWLFYRFSTRRPALTRWSASDVLATLFAVVASVGTILLAPYFAFCVGACSSTPVTISAITVLLALVLGPLAETFLIQGCAYEVARSFIGNDHWWPTVVVTSAVFVALHGMINLELVVSALVLSMVRRATRRLSTVAIAHASINAFVTLLALRS